MFGLGTQELLIILVIAMMLFGAGKLPQVGSSLGKGIRNFKKGMIEENEKSEEELDIVKTDISGQEQKNI